MIATSPASCRRADARARERLELPADIQMERASLGAWALFRETFPRAKTLVVLCGPGANGGDGLALARHALLDGIRPIVCFPGEHPPEWSLSRVQLRRIEALGSGPVPWTEAKGSDPAIPAVDALFGTGLSRPPQGDVAEAVSWLSDRSTLALDLPSGLDGWTGRPLGPCVRACATATFGRMKAGLLLDPGRDFAGAVRVVDIGIPAQDWGEEENVEVLDADWARDRLPPRAPGTHKGSAGKAALLVGSADYFGASVLSASAALRSGAGLVTVASTPDVARRIGQVVPEAMGRAAIGPDALPMERILSKVDAVLAGPGLGTSDEASRALTSLLASWSGPLVLDADALNIVANRADLRERLELFRGRLVLTPHPMEASRLLAVPAQELLSDPLGSAKRLAQTFGAVAVFKTATPAIASPLGRLALGVAGHPGMAVGGCGDALAGAVVARLAEGASPWEATLQAVRAHARAGEIAGAAGRRGMSVTDLVAALPAAWEEMEQI
jgi:ADP-dependent NAD(P)H-hydrate dehydratase / NAD(P)H-hydrate epimerase